MKEAQEDIKITTPQQDEAARAAMGREALENLKERQEPKKETPTDEPKEAKDEELTLKDVIQQQAIEGESPISRTLSLRKILGGDILNTAAIRRQIWLFILIAFFMIIYISNRYSCQQDIIEIDRLQTELQDAKYKALSSTSQLTEKSRESNVLNLLKSNKDSTLKIANQPPYIITIPE